MIFPGNHKRIDNIRVVVPSGGPRGKSHSTQEFLDTIHNRLKSYLKVAVLVLMYLCFNEIFFNFNNLLNDSYQR